MASITPFSSVTILLPTVCNSVEKLLGQLLHGLLRLLPMCYKQFFQPFRTFWEGTGHSHSPLKPHTNLVRFSGDRAYTARVAVHPSNEALTSRGLTGDRPRYKV